jgi:Tfp pilus assembly protein FimT
MRQDRRQASEAGFSITELALVVGIIGIMAAIATPSFLTYYQASRLRVAAEEVAAFINQGRQIGIRENVGVCVHTTPTAMHYHIGNCAEATTKWIGPGTDPAGNIALPEGITLTPPANPPLFTYLGNATPAATYTVTNSQTGATLQVVVAASGRVCISAAGKCVGP